MTNDTALAPLLTFNLYSNTTRFSSVYLLQVKQQAAAAAATVQVNDRVPPPSEFIVEYNS